MARPSIFTCALSSLTRPLSHGTHGQQKNHEQDIVSEPVIRDVQAKHRMITFSFVFKEDTQGVLYCPTVGQELWLRGHTVQGPLCLACLLSVPPPVPGSPRPSARLASNNALLTAVATHSLANVHCASFLARACERLYVCVHSHVRVRLCAACALCCCSVVA